MKGENMSDVQGSLLGNAVLRREDPDLLIGAEKYFDDIEVQGLGYVYFARSSVAHATINSIETSSAKEIDGVIGVWTANDIDMPPQLGFAMFPPVFSRPLLATDKVRFVGDIIAVVVAETASIAADAAAEIWMDFEPLPAVTDPEEALAENAPILFEEHGSNVCFETGIEHEGDDPTEGSEHVAEIKMVSQRIAGVPIEANGIVAIPEEGKLTTWMPTQSPHAFREGLAPLLGLEEENLHIIAPAVGGGFGPKAAMPAEYIATAILAMQLQRPLKWTELRSEKYGR